MIIYSFEFTAPFEAPHYKAEIFETPNGFCGLFGDEGEKFDGDSFSQVVHKMRLVAPKLPFQSADWRQRHLPEPEDN